MKLSIQSFLGIAPKVPPRYLPDGGAQIATNVEATGQSVKPLPGLGGVGLSLSGTSGAIHTIYRWGQDLASEVQYWFRWASAETDPARVVPVHVCRSQIADDTSEWTIFTGDGYPKATYSGIATQNTTNYPAASLRLGLPAPTQALTGTVALPQYCEVNGIRDDTRDTQVKCVTAGTCVANGNYIPGATTKDMCDAVAGGVWTPQTPGKWIVGAKQSPVKVTLTPAMVAEVSSAYGIKLSTNKGTNEVTAAATATAVTVTVTPNMMDAMTEGYGLKVSVDGGLTYATAPLGTRISRTADLTLSAGEIAQFPYQTTLSVVCLLGTVTTPAGPLTSADAVVSALNALRWPGDEKRVSAVRSGSGVYVSSVPLGANVDLRIQWASNAYRTANGANVADQQAELLAAVTAAKINNQAIATAVVSGNNVVITAGSGGENTKLVVRWGDSDSQALTAQGSAVSLSALVTAINALPVTATYTGATAVENSGALEITSLAKGKDATLQVKWGTETAQKLSASGTTGDLGTPESRVYTYTWVLKEGGITWESAPYSSATLTSFDVYAGGAVNLTGFPSSTTLTLDGWGPRQGTLHRRIYRSVNGVYLYVSEIPAATTTYLDKLDADELGEPLPSTLWTPPKAALQGAINLPNGMIAGFVGRDVYFSEPYRPYAWPDTYAMTVDYPIVGLGRMDTTLVVLTKGAPYFIQGSAPDVAVMVKSDIDQACVAKRSIVSMGGVVFYASPDGIMALSSGGSNMLTDGLFTRAQWQAYRPESIHAYGHDNQYRAFFTQEDGTKGGFTIDLKTKQFVTHNLWATAGYTDLRNDSLYLCDTDKNLVKWYAGTNTTGKWKSKIFSHPQPLGYTCAQIEAEDYPVTCRIFCDGVQIKTQTIPNSTYYADTFLIAKRAPFRLPVAHGRDWEVELDVTQEIFNVVLAQAPSELATA